MSKFRRKGVHVQQYRVCKVRKCKSNGGKKVSCKEEYNFKPQGKKFLMDRSEAKLLVARAVPLLAFISAESCAHGIFPSHMGGEMAHAIQELTARVRPRIEARQKKYFLFDDDYPRLEL